MLLTAWILTELSREGSTYYRADSVAKDEQDKVADPKKKPRKTDSKAAPKKRTRKGNNQEEEPVNEEGTEAPKKKHKKKKVDGEEDDAEENLQEDDASSDVWWMVVWGRWADQLCESRKGADPFWHLKPAEAQTELCTSHGLLTLLQD